MRKVKIIYANEYYSEDEGSRMHVDSSITDWEEIADEEYYFLTSNFYHLFPAKNRNYERGNYILLVKDEETIADRIVQLRELIKEQQNKEKVRKEKEEAAKVAKEAKKIEKEKKKLEELKTKYES